MLVLGARGGGVGDVRCRQRGLAGRGVKHHLFLCLGCSDEATPSLLQQRFGSLLQVLVESAAQRVSGLRFLQRAALAARILPSDNVHGTTSRRKRSANAIGCSRARGGFTSLTRSSKLPGLQRSTDPKSRTVLAVFTAVRDIETVRGAPQAWFELGRADDPQR